MTTDSQAIVVATDVHRRFGEGDAAVEALDGVSVDFPKGRFTAIMGPSGSGKSTLMHVLAGLDRPTSGSVVVDGTEISDLDDKELTELRRDKVGFVFQFFNLLPVLTAQENIELPLSIAGRKPDEALLGQLVEAVDLGDRLSHRPSELSGGQQQRVAVARALISKPAVVFADEPTGNLDSSSSEEVLNLLRRAVDEFGQTVVMVTHDPNAAAVADRVLVLVDGKVVQDAEAGNAERRARPAQGRHHPVTAVALRNLWSRKLRTFLTALAIVLGVMMVAGTYVLTDTIDRSFDKIFTESNQGIDAVVSSREAVETDDGQEPPFPASVLDVGAGDRRGGEGLGRHLRPPGGDPRQGRRPHRRQRRADLRGVGAARAIRRVRLRGGAQDRG